MIDIEELRESARLHGQGSAEYVHILDAMFDALAQAPDAFLMGAVHRDDPVQHADCFPNVRGISLEERLISRGQTFRPDALVFWQHSAFDCFFGRPGYRLTFSVGLLDADQKATTLQLERVYQTHCFEQGRKHECVGDVWTLFFGRSDTDAPDQLALSDIERANGPDGTDPESRALREELQVLRERADRSIGIVSDKTAALVARLMVRVLLDKIAQR